MTTISIIIPNLNGANLLPKCLKSLVNAIKKCPQTKFEIILVDNASTDNSLEIFNQYFPHSKTILLNKNYGFAGAVNKGIDTAKSEWVLLCNNDLWIDNHWLSLVSKKITDNVNPKTVALTGTVLNSDGTIIESQGLKHFYSGKCNNINNGQKVSPTFLKKISQAYPKYIWGASAALTLYHRQTLIKIGKFDSDFFAYEEDVDLALRMHNLSYKTIYVPNAICYHLGGATSKQMGNFRHIMDAKNWIYIIIKNYSLKEIVLNFFPIIVQRLRNLSGLIKNTPHQKIFSSLYKTYQPVFINFSLMIKKRHLISSLRH